MVRPAEYTRHAIIKAAIHLFAEKGFEGTSVRDIITKARVNQAAINYHFRGKTGLYLEVLKTASDRLTDQVGFSSDELRSLSREEAVRSFISRQLRPLMFRDECIGLSAKWPRIGRSVSLCLEAKTGARYRSSRQIEAAH